MTSIACLPEQISEENIYTSGRKSNREIETTAGENLWTFRLVFLQAYIYKNISNLKIKILVRFRL
jgi:hypothetical protein